MTSSLHPLTSDADDPLSDTPYRYIKRLGQGGMGEVVEAEHRKLGHHVAVKLLRADDFARTDLKDRMRLEAQACARIRHDHLVLVTDFGETRDGRAYVVMELLRGCSLGDELRRRGALPPPEAVEIVCQALAGLATAHAAGVVHRDLKPDNLFLCDVGGGHRLVKVLDFGIAKIVDSACDPRTPRPLREPTAEGIAVGTPRYASPEQSRAERDIDARTDVYSMGWLLHVLLTGQEPFPDRQGAADLARAHHTEMPPLPSALARHPIPTELDRIVMKAISKRRDDRHPSAAALRAELVQLGQLDARGPGAGSSARAAASNAAAPNVPVAGASAAAPHGWTGTETLDAPTASGRPGAQAAVPTATVELGPSLAALAPASAGRVAATAPLVIRNPSATQPMPAPRRRGIPFFVWCIAASAVVFALAVTLRVLGVW